MIILGLDPGLANTGWGIVEERRGDCRCRAYGCIHTTTDQELAPRLRHIVDELAEVARRYHPDAAAIESIFFGANTRSAIPTAHARGAALAGRLNVPCQMQRICAGKGNQKFSHIVSPCKATAGERPSSRRQRHYFRSSRYSLYTVAQISFFSSVKRGLSRVCWVRG